MKTRKTISNTEIFPLWPPLLSAKKSSALEQGGVCFLFPSHRGNLDAAFLLTVGSFLLTVQLFYLQLKILAFYLQFELFCLQF